MRVMFTIWRHPKPRGAVGRCIGSRTDLPVDPRKAKRLAHRIRAYARQQGLPPEVATSPLTRAADVGRWLKRWGFRWHVDAALAEMDFSAWDGKAWAGISAAEFERWMRDFCGFDFDGGEPLGALIARAAAWEPPCALAVGHAGWIAARAWAEPHVPTPDRWPAPLAYGARLTLAADLSKQ